MKYCDGCHSCITPCGKENTIQDKKDYNFKIRSLSDTQEVLLDNFARALLHCGFMNKLEMSVFISLTAVYASYGHFLNLKNKTNDV